MEGTMKISTKIKMAFGAIKSLSGSEMIDMAKNHVSRTQKITGVQTSSMADMIRLVGQVYDHGFDGLRDQLDKTDAVAIEAHASTVMDTVQDLLDVFESRQDELQELVQFGKDFLKEANASVEKAIKEAGVDVQASKIVQRLASAYDQPQPSMPEGAAKSAAA